MIVKKENTYLWHKRLGYLNRNSLLELGLPFSSETSSTWIEGKDTRLSFVKQAKTSRQIGELIHLDICGSIHPLSHNGEKYFQVIIDDFSNFTVVNYIKKKIEADELLVAYVVM